jgi:hypothetical protein
VVSDTFSNAEDNNGSERYVDKRYRFKAEQALVVLWPQPEWSLTEINITNPRSPACVGDFLCPPVLCYDELFSISGTGLL